MSEEIIDEAYLVSYHTMHYNSDTGNSVYLPVLNYSPDERKPDGEKDRLRHSSVLSVDELHVKS